MKASCLLDYSLVAQQKRHELNLLVKLKAPELGDIDRKPLNLGVVLDRSGSMHGGKLDKAKESMEVLLGHLSAKDLLTVVTFDDEIDVLANAQPMAEKDLLRRRLRLVHPRGCTNLSGGYIKAIELVAAKATEDYVNHILLLSDGHANRGITDHGQLAGIGHSAHAGHGITSTMLGYGEGFDEDLLTGISDGAGGKFYYIETADSAPEVFQEELGDLLTLVAQNIEVSIRPATPVEFMVQWTNHPAVQEDGKVTFSLTDAYSGEEKSVLLGLLIPGLSELGACRIADLEVRFAEIQEQKVELKQIKQEVRVNVAPDDEAGSAEPDVEVLRQLGLQWAARARKEAIEEADQGNFGKAQEILREAGDKISQLPGEAGEALKGEAEELRDQAGTTVPSTYTGTRKAMSSDWSSTSKGHYDKLYSSRERRKRMSSRETDSRITDLIQLASEKGYLTKDDVRAGLPPDLVDPVQLKSILDFFRSKGIDIREADGDD